jgi:hypothetical protein
MLGAGGRSVGSWSELLPKKLSKPRRLVLTVSNPSRLDGWHLGGPDLCNPPCRARREGLRRVEGAFEVKPVRDRRGIWVPRDP